MKKNIFVLCIMVLFAPLSWSAIEVSAVFSDRAVLQGGKDLPVWGWGEPGDAVSVSFAGQTELTTVEADGSWRVTLSPVAASYTKYTMEINVGAESLELVDLLVGEVWLGSGQSNMALAFDGFAPSKDEGYQSVLDYMTNERDTAEDDYLRMITVPNVSSEAGERSFNGQWLAVAPENTGSFSGTAYFFAKELRQRLNCPVGIMLSAWGGTRIEYWIPPSGIYNGMIHPLVPYAMRGVVWYQGESHNQNHPEWYLSSMESWVAALRSDWGQGDFPFYYCQLANHSEPLTEPTTPPASWVIISNQQRLALSITNTGMAVLNDVGQINDIHPKNKLDVGLRLSKWALNKTYGFADIQPSGPLYNSSLIKEHSVSITFDYSGSGLMVGQKTLLDPVVPISDPLGGFQICGEDRVWMWGDAQIVGANEVEVGHPSIARPVAVRYAWQQNPLYSNLYNQEGLSASLFATIDPELHGVAGDLSTYVAWVQSYDLSGSAAEHNEDPDADGYVNILEYALGLNPIVSDVAGKDMLTVSGQAATLILPRPARQDLLYKILSTADSTTWEVFASRWKDDPWGGNYVVQDPAAGVREVRFTVPVIYSSHLFQVVALDANSNPPNGDQLTVIGEDNFDGGGIYLSRQNSNALNRGGLVWNVVNRTNVGDGSIIDTSLFTANGSAGDNNDNSGFLESDKTDNFFGMYRGGGRTLTYSFDVSGYSNLSLSMDWAASGDVPNPGISVTTAIDGALPVTNLAIETSGTDWSETMENGAVLNRGRSASVTVNGMAVPSLSDEFQTYAWPVTGTGDVLVVTVTMTGSPAAPSFGMDNLKLSGFEPIAVTFASWTEYYGLSGDEALWDFDKDLDGLNNFEEYAFGGNPLDTGNRGYTQRASPVTDGESKFFEYVYTRRSTSDHGLTYAAETSSNLAPDDWTTDGVIELPDPVTIGADFEEVKTRVLMVEDTGFMRVRVEESP
jgi:hypothetical protein